MSGSCVDISERKLCSMTQSSLGENAGDLCHYLDNFTNVPADSNPYPLNAERLGQAGLHEPAQGGLCIKTKYQCLDL